MVDHMAAGRLICLLADIVQSGFRAGLRKDFYLLGQVKEALEFGLGFRSGKILQVILFGQRQYRLELGIFGFQYFHGHQAVGAFRQSAEDGIGQRRLPEFGIDGPVE